MTQSVLHPALYALADVTLAVDRQTFEIADVNRASSSFGYAREELVAMTLDALTGVARPELGRFLSALDGRSLELLLRPKGGAEVRATGRASLLAGANGAHALVTLRETSSDVAELGADRATLRDDLDKAQRLLASVSERLGRGVSPAVVAPAVVAPAVVAPAVVAPAAVAPAAVAPQVVAPQAVAPQVVAPQVVAPQVVASQVLVPSAAQPVVVKPPIPDLAPEHYASLLAEIDVHPARRAEIEARYGVASEVVRAELDRVWADRFARDGALKERGHALVDHYRDWFDKEARREVVHEVPPQSTPAATGAPHEAAARAPAKVERTTAPEHAANAPAALPFGPGDRDPRATVGVTSFQKGAPLPFKPADVPDLSIDQYAAMMAELGGYPDRQTEVRAMYGIHSEAVFRACEAHWMARFGADPALRQKWVRLVADFGKALVK